MVKIVGDNFGVGPNVLLYADFSKLPEGQLVSLDSPDIGSWNAYHYLTTLQPKSSKIFGRAGVEGREGGTNTTTNRLTGFESSFPPFKNFAVSTDIAIPEDRTFPGAATPKTKSNVSSLKHVWLSDEALDRAAKADICIHSWTTSSFSMVGNDSPVGVSVGGDFDFEGWNYFFGYSVAGQDSFLDTGSVGALNISEQGVRENFRTNSPAYIYRTRISVTAVPNFTYTVTINDEHVASYTSGVSQTAAQIAQGLRGAIDELSLDISTSIAGSAITVSSNPLTKSVCTVGQNLTTINTEPQYTHLAYPAWQGNGSQDLAQTVSSYIYLAASDDSSVLSRIVLLNSDSLSTSTMYHVVPPSLWTNTEVEFEDRFLREGATHVAVITSEGQVLIESLGATGNITVVTPPEITGSPIVRQELTCNPGTYTSPNGAVSVIGYTWYVDDVPAQGVHTNTFTPVDSSYGKVVSCTVQLTDGVNTESYSASTTPLAGITPQVTLSPVTGKPEVGRTVRVNISVDAVPEAEVSIEWVRVEDDEILSTGSNAYRITEDDLGESIFPRVTASNLEGEVTEDGTPIGPITPFVGVSRRNLPPFWQ